MIGTLLLLAQLVSAPAEAVPIEATIAAIRANPKRFDGQIVRLHGWVNSCQPMSCLLDERAANAPAGRGQSLSIDDNPKFDGAIRPLLPTYVEFDARFDARCLTIEVCLDRAPMLSIVSLRGVVSPEPPETEN
jgi:hypothetical protein